MCIVDVCKCNVERINLNYEVCNNMICRSMTTPSIRCQFKMVAS